MNRKYLLGAAMVALLAGTSGARAADVLPPVVIVPPVETAADPLTIEIEAGLAAFWVPIESISSYWAYLEGDITYETPNGWGVELVFGGETGLSAPGFEAGAELNVYKSLGALSLGAVFGAAGESGGDPTWFWLGPTLGYETAALEADFSVEFDFADSVYQGFSTFADVTFDVSDRFALGLSAEAYFYGGPVDYEVLVEAAFDITDRLTLHGAVDVLGEIGNGAFVQGAAALELDLGAFSPYVVIAHTFDFAIGVGVSVEHQIGTGPFSLVGNVGATIYPGEGTAYNANIGIRFNHGETDDSPLDYFAFPEL